MDQKYTKDGLPVVRLENLHSLMTIINRSDEVEKDSMLQKLQEEQPELGKLLGWMVETYVRDGRMGHAVGLMTGVHIVYKALRRQANAYKLEEELDIKMEDNQKKEGCENLEGRLHFYMESGTEGGHWAFLDDHYVKEQNKPYNHLHILKSGDKLVIYKKGKEQIAWEGVIDLQLYRPFTQNVNGLWIHSDQKGIKRELWASYFFSEHKAELIKSKK